MRYQWGPLLRDGGERRLNVAATRAKHRLTLVSSFSSHDIDPDRVTKAGARLLADYLEYASSGGTAVRASGSDQLNPFEADVRDRLAEFGITVVPQYGVGGYRIDFAAAHPQDPDRMVLAIEADGASYRESGSVRDRDRLRGEHLQRLGWSFHRLWSTNWFYDAKDEVTKLRDAYDRAVAAADEAAPPPPPAPPPPAPGVPLGLGEQRAAPGRRLDPLLCGDVDLLLAVRVAAEEVPDPVQQALLLRVHVGLPHVEHGRFELRVRQRDRDRGAVRRHLDRLALEL